MPHIVTTAKPHWFYCIVKDMATFRQDSPHLWLSLNENYRNQKFKPCFNYEKYQVCNWVIAADDPHIYCESCQLTHTIPTHSEPDNLVYWRHLEQTKRRCLYLAQRINLYPAQMQ